MAAMLVLPVSSLVMNAALASPDDDSGYEESIGTCVGSFPAPSLITQISGMQVKFTQDPAAVIPNCYEPGAVAVWDFGDGTVTRTGAVNLSVGNTEHVYREPGTYQVKAYLESRDGSARSHAAELTVSVKDDIPAGDCVAAYPAPAIKTQSSGLRTVFYQDPEAPVANCHEPGAVLVWDFGDGSQYRVSAENLDVRQIDHIYEDSGDYQVKAYFESRESGFRSKTAEIPVTVKDVDPVVHIRPDYSVLYRHGEDELREGDTIHISGAASLSKKGRKIVSYLWSTGETTPEIDFPVDSEFLERGASVTLTVTDEDGNTQSRSMMIDSPRFGPRSCGVPPIYTVWTHFSAEGKGKEVTFADSSSDDLGGMCPVDIDSGIPLGDDGAVYASFSGTNVFWDFGDGTTVSSPAEETKAVHTYDKAGDYTVLYAVIFAEENSIIHTTAQKVTVADTGLRAVITAEGGDDVMMFRDNVIVLTDAPIVLSAASSEGLDDSVTYKWSTGETTPSITVTPDYNKDLAYSVEITDGNGTSSSAEVRVRIERPVCSPAPLQNPNELLTPDFSMSEDSVNGLEAKFSGRASIMNTSGCAWIAEPVSDGVWLWDFGDETMGTGSTVTHVYKNPGEYKVTLTVTSGELTNSVTKLITVQDECTPCTRPDPEDPPLERIAGVTATKGQQIVLDAVAYLGHYEDVTYLWSTGEKGSSVTVQPTEDSVYKAEVYDDKAKLVAVLEIYVKITDPDADDADVIPTIVISTSADNTNRTVLSGTEVTFDASHTYIPSDPEGSASELTYRWSNGKTGSVITEVIDRDTTLTLEVTNSKGHGVSTAAVTIKAKASQNAPVHVPPVARISYSGSGDAIRAGTNMVFTGTANGLESERTYTYSWTVDGKTVAGSDRVLNYVFTGIGKHYVTFTATDDLGLSDTAGTILYVTAEGAFVTIDGSNVATVGENAVFTAKTAISDTSGNVVWTVDGNLVPNTQNNVLSYVFNTAGTHEITAGINDAEGVKHTAKHTVTVNVKEKEPLQISFAEGNQSVTDKDSDKNAVPFVNSGEVQEKPLRMQIQGHVALMFRNISGTATLHVLRTEREGDAETTVACRIGSDFVVSCDTPADSGTSLEVKNDAGVNLQFSEVGEYQIHISARSESSAETQGYIPLNVTETLDDTDTPDEETPEPLPPEKEQDDGSDSDASGNTGNSGSGGKKGGALDFLSLLFLTGSSILLRGRRKK